MRMLCTANTKLFWILVFFGMFSTQNLYAQDTAVDKTVTIKAVPGLKYDVARFVATPGNTIKIMLENVSEMPHNMLIVAPGTREKVVKQAAGMGTKGLENDFVPSTPQVLSSIPLLDPDESGSVIFQVPEQPGVYPYVCTYPSHGIIMYGAIYVTRNPGDLPPLAEDPHIPKTHKPEQAAGSDSPHPYPMEMPEVTRIFMPDASPAAIAVGMEQNQSYCWDAGYCFLRYAWEGGYIDASELWEAKTKEQAKIKGEVYFRNKVGFPFRVGRRDSIPKPEFKGYTMIDGYPQFMYAVGDIRVKEFIQPAEEGTGLKIRYQIEGAQGPVWYAKMNEQAAYKASRGDWQGPFLKLTAEEAHEFIISIKPE